MSPIKIEVYIPGSNEWREFSSVRVGERTSLLNYPKDSEEQAITFMCSRDNQSGQITREVIGNGGDPGKAEPKVETLLSPGAVWEGDVVRPNGIVDRVRARLEK